MPPFRNRLRTPEFSRKKRRILYVKMALLVLLVSAVVGGLSYVSHRDTLRVNEVVIEGGEVVDERALRNLIMSKLSGKYLFLFPKDNAFLYSRSGLEAAALQSFKRLKTVEVSTDGLQTVVLSVSEREPTALWCGENRPWGEISTACYFMDEEGYIYAESPGFTGDAYRRFYGPLASGEPVGQAFIESVRFREFLNFFSELEKEEVFASELVILGDGEYELYLEDGTRIVFSDAQTLTRVYDNLLSVLSSEELKDRVPLNLEYIDLRFGNKVYYKERVDSE